MGNYFGRSTDPSTRETRERREKNKRQVTDAMREMKVEEIRCGISFCTPAWLQPFATREMYLLVYCIVGLVIGMFFTYSVSTISTVEKRFKLSSKQIGIILAGNDVSQVLLSILVAYFANYGNRPKWLGIGVLFASLSCFLSVVPHYIYGPGQDAIDVARTTMINSNSSYSSFLLNSTNYVSLRKKEDLCYSPYDDDCSKNVDSNYIGPVIILFMAEFLVGISVTVFYSIGLVYLDDNVNKKDSPLYYAVSMIVRVVGPVMGFFLGSKCLAIYIDPYNKPNINLRDPRWLGAWWLGYLILGFLLVLCGVLLLFFPRSLPATIYKEMTKVQKEITSKQVQEIPANPEYLAHLLKLTKAKQRFTKPSIARLPSALKRVFTNKIWVGTNFNTVLMLLAMMGYWSFKPKYLEYQFRISASTATFYAGVASLVASILGLAISGIIIKVFRPSPRFITAYSCFLTLYSSVMMIALMFIGCPKLDIVGPSYKPSSELFTCSSDCSCTDRYSPVCSEDNVTTFYSSCYAGCTAVNSSATPIEYYNCLCINSNVTSSNLLSQTSLIEEKSQIQAGSQGGKARHGYCPETCDTFYYYIVVTILTKTIDSTGRIGGTLIYLRSLEEQDKGLALGVSTVLISLFAFIPAPIIMGAVVDSACIIWDNTCGVKGNCWLYDSDKFRVLVHVVPAAIIFVSLIGDIMVYMYSKDLVLYGEDEEENGPQEGGPSEEMEPLKKNGGPPQPSA